MNFFHWIESYITGKRIAVYPGSQHGPLEVWMVNGKMVLNSPNANQSYDSLHDIFRKTFEEIRFNEQPLHHILLLGLGVGSIPAIIEEELMMNCMVTAVENDPLMIGIGKKYFHLDRFKHLRIVQEDALHFIQTDHHRFDAIIIDLFIDDKVPAPFMEESFLDRLTQHLTGEGLIIFNMIVRDQQQQEQFNRMQHYFLSKEGTCKVLAPVSPNKVLCWFAE